MKRCGCVIRETGDCGNPAHAPGSCNRPASLFLESLDWGGIRIWMCTRCAQAAVASGIFQLTDPI